MADIFVMIRNQDNIALTSIDGIAFVTLLQQSRLAIAEETVDLFYADASFDDLPLGQYTVVVTHERVEPQEATREVRLTSQDDIVLLTFIYLEPKRVLLGIEASVEKRL